MFQYNGKDGISLRLRGEGPPSGGAGLSEQEHFELWEAEMGTTSAEQGEQLAIPGVDAPAEAAQDGPVLPVERVENERRGSKFLRRIGKAALGVANWNNERRGTDELAESATVISAQVAGAYYRDTKEKVGNTINATKAGSKVVALAAKKSGGRIWKFAKKVGRRIKSDVTAGAGLAGGAVSATSETIGEKADGIRENVEGKVSDAKEYLINRAREASVNRQNRRIDKINAMNQRRRDYLADKIRDLNRELRAVPEDIPNVK